VNDASDSKSHSNFKYSYISRLLLVRNWNLHPFRWRNGKWVQKEQGLIGWYTGWNRCRII